MHEGICLTQSRMVDEFLVCVAETLTHAYTNTYTCNIPQKIYYGVFCKINGRYNILFRK